jgi:hypothetical protein
MLEEEAKGEDSFFKFYIRSFPKVISVFPIMYTEKELAMLEGHYIKE